MKLNGLTLDFTVSIHKAIKKEMVNENNPKQEIGRIPRPWRNADGSKVIEEKPVPVVV